MGDDGTTNTPPNARAKGRGRTKLGEKHQSVTPRPLERRVGLPRRERKQGHMAFAFAPYNGGLLLRSETALTRLCSDRSTKITKQGGVNPLIRHEVICYLMLVQKLDLLLHQ